MSSGQLLVWKGQVPISIELQFKNATLFTKYFFLAKRVSYLPLYDGQVSRHFNAPIGLSNCLIERVDGPSIPLPWHLPIGVIYDMFASHPNFILNLALIQKKADHKSSSDIVDLSEVSMAFYARLKEADAISSGSSVPKIIPLIPQQQHEAIFNTIVTNDFGKHIDNAVALTLHNLPVRIWDGKRWRISAFNPESTLSENEPGQVDVIRAHGILFDRNILMKEAYKELKHPDGFLYLIFAKSS
jgi:hypothetical protein